MALAISYGVYYSTTDSFFVNERLIFRQIVEKCRKT